MVKASKRNPVDVRPGTLCEVAILAANVLALVLPLVMVQLFDRVIPNNAHHTLSVLATVLLFAILLEALLRGAVSRLLDVAGERYEVEAQDRLVAHILNAPPERLQHLGPSEHFENLDTIERVRAARVADNRHSIFDIPFAVLFLAAFWYVAPPLFLAMLGVLALTVAGSALTRRRARRLSETRRDQRRRSLSLLTEILGGVEHLKGIRAEPFMLRRLESLYANVARSTEMLVMTQAVGKVLTEVAAQATPLVIGLFGALAVIDGSITSGALAAAILLSGRIVQPFLRQQQVREQERLLAASVRALNDVLAADPEKPSTVEATPLERVDLCGIGFTGQNGRVILDGIDLSLTNGEIVAITGVSGSGKSVLLRLLSGQLVPTRGEVRVNGHALGELGKGDHAARTGFMAQSLRTPSGTALDLITGFAGRSQLPAVLPIAEELGLSGVFAVHPQGMSVGVGGTAARGLPSAVEARLPLVATLSRAPELLLFDEANSALDIESDHLLLAALRRRKGSMTMILITQRPSYAALADRRYALEAGRLVEIDEAGFLGRITGEKAA